MSLCSVDSCCNCLRVYLQFWTYLHRVVLHFLVLPFLTVRLPVHLWLAASDLLTAKYQFATCNYVQAAHGPINAPKVCICISFFHRHWRVIAGIMTMRRCSSWAGHSQTLLGKTMNECPSWFTKQPWIKTLTLFIYVICEQCCFNTIHNEDKWSIDHKGT